ncbi:MAG: hypothetical protein ABIS47_09520 [Acidimicrobiales bacterium]
MAGGRGTAEGPVEVPVVGAEVEVRQRYTERWARGFQVARVDLTGNEPAVLVRRRSDGSVLPATFPLSDVRST